VLLERKGVAARIRLRDWWRKRDGGAGCRRARAGHGNGGWRLLLGCRSAQWREERCRESQAGLVGEVGGVVVVVTRRVAVGAGDGRRPELCARVREREREKMSVGGDREADMWVLHVRTKRFQNFKIRSKLV
jgi:hypothetical protein